MTIAIYRMIAICLLVMIGLSGSVSGSANLDQLNTIMDSARGLEAPIFAPKTWDKAMKKHRDAMGSIKKSKKQSTIEKHVNEAREYTESAIKASEVCKLSLQQHLPPRERARAAKAVMLVPVLYQKAEEAFVKATAKVESGDVKGALKQAKKAAPLYDIAELEAVRVDILGSADKLIEKSLADDAGKFALSTFDKARSARNRADAIIVADRYNREAAVAEATLAEYEARHAANIGLSVRSLKRNDQAWEKLMLVYEIQMNRVGVAVGADYVPFDKGPIAAADTLISQIADLQSDNQRLAGDIDKLSLNLGHALSQFKVSSDNSDPVAMSGMVGDLISELLSQRDDLVLQVASGSDQMAEMSREHEGVAAELAGRTEREEKFRRAKMMLNPSEGEILFNSSNDIVLRLTGLSFNVGKSDIKDDHIALLEKVKEVIQMFPEGLLVIEGHTDASGDASANILLSEKRAFAVMQYLRQSLLISASRIRSMGYGADRPVASNQNADGRAKNRRIDIIIMQ